MKRLLGVCAGVCFAALATPAHAFHSGQTFAQTANAGGGGGMFFTGAKRWKRYDCTICHAGSSDGLAVSVASSPPSLVEEGRWDPGQTYTITVEMLGESRGLTSGSNLNTFVAEFTDAAGRPVGAYEFDAVELATWDRGLVIAARGNATRTSWQFRFAPPTAGTGTLHFNIAMVDGNGAGVSLGRRTDILGDGVATRHLALCETGTDCDGAATGDDPSTTGGCATGGRLGGAEMVAMVLGLLAVARRRR